MQLSPCAPCCPSKQPMPTSCGYAAGHGHVMITCNRDDFLALAPAIGHAGIIVLIRRKSRIAERAALVQLLDKAGKEGIEGNINFA